MNLISWKRPEHFRNCAHFSSQLRLIICGSSGSGKTSVLYNLLLDSCPVHQTQFLDYDSLVLVLPSLNQDIYQILIKGFGASLTRRHVRKLIEVQDRVSDVESAIKLVGNLLSLEKKRDKTFTKDEADSKTANAKTELNIQVSTYNSPADLPAVEELNSDRFKRVLVVMDDSKMHDLTRAEDYFCRARNQNIKLVFITQSFTKLKRITIRINWNSYLLFRQPDTILRDPIYEEIASSDFASFDAYREFVHSVWKSKHDFILINLYDRKYYDSTFHELNSDYSFRQDKNEMSRSEYLRNLEKAVKAERASTMNLMAKQGKTMSELLLSETRQKQFAPITSEVKALQPILKALAVAPPQPVAPAQQPQVLPQPAPQQLVVAKPVQHAVAQPAVAAAPPVAQKVVAAPAV